MFRDSRKQMIVDIVDSLFKITEFILISRFIFKLTAASSTAPFVKLIYNLSFVVYEPFASLVPAFEIGTIEFEWIPTAFDTYTFEAFAPPVPGEASQEDNLASVQVSLRETLIFDGLYIKYIFDNMGYIFNTNFT